MRTEENFREKSRPRHPICVEKREEITIDKETDSLCVVARPPLPPRRVASPHAPSPGRVPPGVPLTTTRSVGSRRVRVYGRRARRSHHLVSSLFRASPTTYTQRPRRPCVDRSARTRRGCSLVHAWRSSVSIYARYPGVANAVLKVRPRRATAARTAR